MDYIDRWKVTLGGEIASIRRDRNMTQSELGERAGGLSQKTVSDIERGLNSVIDNYIMLCTALDMDFALVTARARLMMKARLEASCLQESDLDTVTESTRR